MKVLKDDFGHFGEGLEGYAHYNEATEQEEKKGPRKDKPSTINPWLWILGVIALSLVYEFFCWLLSL